MGDADTVNLKINSKPFLTDTVKKQEGILKLLWLGCRNMLAQGHTA